MTKCTPVQLPVRSTAWVLPFRPDKTDGVSKTLDDWRKPRYRQVRVHPTATATIGIVPVSPSKTLEVTLFQASFGSVRVAGSMPEDSGIGVAATVASFADWPQV